MTFFLPSMLHAHESNNDKSKKTAPIASMAVGDIAFIGYNTGGQDGFAFIALTDLPAGQTLYLTEQGWDGNVWMSSSTETHLSYVIPSGITCGTIVSVVETAPDVFTVTGGGSIAIVQGSGFSLSGGDQIIAYQSNSGVAPASPIFISGVHGDYNSSKYDVTTTWNPVSANSTSWANSDCALPTGLTNGVNCISLYPAPGPEHLNAKYNGTLTGTATALRGAINTPSNWISNDLSTSYAITPSDYPARSVNCAAATPPSVTGHPSSASVCAGGTTTFSVTASNAVSYQWQANMGSGYVNITNGGVYSGATTATLTITGATAGMNGYMFRCVVTGAALPNATSNGATLTVNAAPAITTQPSSSAICAGANTTFSIAASNATGYQWQVDQGGGYTNISNGGVYSGATTAILAITGATAGINGYAYRVVVTGTCTPNATSNGVLLTVNAAAAITTQPTSRTICAAANTTFSIAASNATGYQWQVDQGAGYTNISNGGVYSGATTATLTITGATAGMNGFAYRAVSTGACTPNATSNGVLLTVNAAPSITTQPSSRTICAAANTTFSIAASNATGYQWQVDQGAGYTNISNGGVYSGATTATLTITGATAGLNGYAYRAVVTGTCTPAAVSNGVLLTVTSVNATTAYTNVSCNGGSNGTATVVANGGSAPYSYSWAPSGGTGATATGLAAGSYTVTITDNNTCQATKNFAIIQPTVLAATTSQTNVSCNGGNNGSATVSVSGGTPAYTYSWSPSGGTAATASGLAEGTYTCTITDANTCQITKTFTITQPTVISLTTGSQTNVACNSGSNGSASVTPSGGTGAYTYSWSPSGGTAAAATGLTAGTYTVTVTDANTCQNTRTFTITQPTVISLTTGSQTNVACNSGSNGSASVTPSGGTGAYTYSWSPSGGTAATATGLSAGTYTVTVADANTCTATRSFTITQPAAITVTATPGSETICGGSQTDIALTSSPTGSSFSWTVSAVSGNISGAAASSGSSIQQTLTGNGVVKYTITPTNGSCTGTAKEVLVTVNALTTIEMQPTDKMIDEEETAKFSIEANNATAYQWQVDAGSGFANISNNAHYSGATNITLTISNALGSMDGYLYRCVATGNCAPVSSNSAKLSVRVRTSQTITFANTNTVVYGASDFAPAASSDAGLDITYTSSDEAVATIVSGKVHVLKAGETIITANQEGNNDYKPATPVTQTLTITKKDITLSLGETPVITKVYDGTATATIAPANYTFSGVVEGDEVSVSATAAYTDSKPGAGKLINVDGFVLGGEQQGNYNLTTPAATITGDITKKEISVALSNTPLISKMYDGSSNATLQAQNYSVVGLVGEEQVSVTGTASYDNKNAGLEKQISVTDFVLDGADKDNYTVLAGTETTIGDITTKEISVTIASTPAISKVYDGTAKVAIGFNNYTLQDKVEGDDLFVTGYAVYDNKNVGTEKSITVSELMLDGNDKDNYTLTASSVSATGDITQATIKALLEQSPAITKEYDGNTSATLAAGNYTVDGIIGEDDVVLNNPANGLYDNKHGGEGKKVTVTGLDISGEDAANYQLMRTTISGNIGIITRKVITITAQAQSKQYGSSDPALDYVAEGKLEEDALSGNLERAEGKNVGTYAIAIGTLSGGDDYTIESFTPADLTITPAPLVVKVEDKTRKQGTVNPVFTFTYDGLVDGDTPADLDSLPVAQTSAVAASPTGVYDIAASGAASGNYNITFSSGKLTVTPASDASYSVKVWNSGPGVLQISIYSDVAQKAAITLYTETGQQLILQQKQLSAGTNSITLNVGNLSWSTYILGVHAEKFKDAQKVKTR